MVQTVKSWSLPSQQQKILIEKPRVLRRIFFEISAVLPTTAGYKSEISFDDPRFFNYYTMIGPILSFKAKGEGIFQGNVWVRNESTIPITYSVTEILV